MTTRPPQPPSAMQWGVEAMLSRDGIDYEALLLVTSDRNAVQAELDRWLAQHDMTATSSKVTKVRDLGWDILRDAGLSGEAVVPCAVGFANARRLPDGHNLTGLFIVEPLANVSPWVSRQIDPGETAAPKALHSLLFGEPSPEGQAKDAAYAIIDSNRFFGVAERLSVSGLRYRCL